MKPVWAVLVTYILLLGLGFGLGWCTKPVPISITPPTIQPPPSAGTIVTPPIEITTKPKPKVTQQDKKNIDSLLQSKDSTIARLALLNKQLMGSSRDTTRTTVMASVAHKGIITKIPVTLSLDTRCFPEDGSHLIVARLDTIKFETRDSIAYYAKYYEVKEGFFTWKTAAIIGGTAAAVLAISAAASK